MNLQREPVPPHIAYVPTTFRSESGMDVTLNLAACETGLCLHHCCRTDRGRDPHTDEPSNYLIIGSDPPWCCGCGKSATELGLPGVEVITVTEDELRAMFTRES